MTPAPTSAGESVLSPPPLLIASTMLAVEATDGAAAEPARQLDPATRSVAFMALLGMALVGLLAIVAVMIGARWARRLASERPGATRLDPTPRSQTPALPPEGVVEWTDRRDPGADTLVEPPPEDTVAD